MNWSQRENQLAFHEHGLTLMLISCIWYSPCANYWHVLIPLLENMTIHCTVEKMRVSYGTSKVELNKLSKAKIYCWCFLTVFCLGTGKFWGGQGRWGRPPEAHIYPDPPLIPPSRVLYSAFLAQQHHGFCIGQKAIC